MVLTHCQISMGWSWDGYSCYCCFKKDGGWVTWFDVFGREDLRFLSVKSFFNGSLDDF